MNKNPPAFMYGYAAWVIENHFPNDMNKGILSDPGWRAVQGKGKHTKAKRASALQG